MVKSIFKIYATFFFWQNQYFFALLTKRIGRIFSGIILKIYLNLLWGLPSLPLSLSLSLSPLLFFFCLSFFFFHSIFTFLLSYLPFPSLSFLLLSIFLPSSLFFLSFNVCVFFLNEKKQIKRGVGVRNLFLIL